MYHICYIYYLYVLSLSIYIYILQSNHTIHAIYHVPSAVYVGP